MSDSDARSAYSRMEEEDALFEKGDLDDAIECCNKVLEPLP
jgi:hypothetical protein